eukprot:2008168-Alexandrium_andersonii.AAC.1
MVAAVVHRPLRRGPLPAAGLEGGADEDTEEGEGWQAGRDPSALCPWGWGPLEDCPDCRLVRAARREATASADPYLHGEAPHPAGPPVWTLVTRRPRPVGTVLLSMFGERTQGIWPACGDPWLPPP